MSCLVAVARRRAHAALPIPSTSKILLSSSFTQSATRKRFETKVDKKKADAGGGQKEKKKVEKSPGTFRTMNLSQLSHPIFDEKSEIGIREFPTLTRDYLRTASPGNITQFSDTADSAMVNYGLPRNMLIEFRLLSKPCSVIRKATLDLAKLVDTASSKSSADSRFVMTGAAGVGKSYLMLQTVQYCLSHDWIVLYIPRASNLVNSTTAYSYDSRTQLYFQPTAALQILTRFLKTNKSKLHQMHLREDIEVDKRNPVPAGTTFKDFIEIGIKDSLVAPSILSAALEALGKQTQHPILLAVDDFQSLYCRSTYRDPQYSLIRSYHLSTPRLLMEYASGQKSFARGAVLGSLSMQDTQFPAPLELREALGISNSHPISPYTKRTAALVEYAQGLRPIPVPEKLEFAEAAAIFELWSVTKAMHHSPTDELFLSKYSEACGNARDFVRGGFLAGLAL